MSKLLFGFFLLSLSAVAALRWLPPPSSAFMLRAEALAWLEGRWDFVPRYRWTDWANLSPHASMAVIAAEDQRFASHFGFDFDAIARVWESNRDDRHWRGASTLTQQTAKNLFLYPGKNFFRKGLEAYFTLLMETMWPKRRILEMYLNIAQFGDGIYGVEAASQAFFRKPSRLLEPGEAALLAAVLPNPLRLRVDRPSAYVLKRRAWILKQMRQLGGTGFLSGV